MGDSLTLNSWPAVLKLTRERTHLFSGKAHLELASTVLGAEWGLYKRDITNEK